MNIEQTRHQFYYKPNAGGGRNKHIRAWELLTQRATAHHYHKRLNDRTVEGLSHCIKAWLLMHEIDFVVDGPIITVDGGYALEVLSTHRSSSVLPPTFQGDNDHVKIYSLWDFLTWYDRTFTIDF